jgi:hypothetical protein
MKTIKYFIFLAVFTMAATGMFAGQVILQQDFNLMVYGGDAIGNRPGIVVDTAKTKWDITTDPGKVSLPNPVECIECTAGMLATSFFMTSPATEAGSGRVSDSYKALRGILGWTGSNIFEQPGYVTFGYSSSTSNWLSTPALSDIVETKDLRVSFKVARRTMVSANTRMTVSITGAGTITGNVGGGTPTSLATAPGGIDFPITDGGVWLEKEITVTGATSETKIRFETTEYTGSGADQVRNFSLDDILVETIDDGSSISAVASGRGDDISVYVSPADRHLYFSNAIPIRKVEIISLSGRTVVAVTHPEEPRVSLSGIPSGIYLVRFITQEGSVINKKISLF